MEITDPIGNPEPNSTIRPEPATMTIQAAALVLGIGRQTAYQLAREGKLPVLRLGRRLLVTKAGLKRPSTKRGET